jgi:Zn-dependent protease with chaperone function
MSRDLRKFASQTNTRLIVGALVLIFVVGDGLIYLFYGRGAAILGLLCLLAGIVPIVLTLMVLALLNWITKRADRE